MDPQAAAWRAVAQALSSARPKWWEIGGTGKESAVAAIKELGALRGQLEAAEQHVKVLQAQVEGLSPETPESGKRVTSSACCERTLLDETRKLLRQMRDDVFKGGAPTGRSQRAGEELIHRIDGVLATPETSPERAALEQIRSAGNDSHPWAVWMQKVAAHAMDPRWPHPGDQPNLSPETAAPLDLEWLESMAKYAGRKDDKAAAEKLLAALQPPQVKTAADEPAERIS